jgi:hypothetical protein
MCMSASVARVEPGLWLSSLQVLKSQHKIKALNLKHNADLYINKSIIRKLYRELRAAVGQVTQGYIALCKPSPEHVVYTGYTSNYLS